MSRNVFLPLMIALPVLIIVSCRNREATDETESKVVTPVTVTPVLFKTINSVSDLPAISSFLKKSNVRATATGYLQKAEVIPGDKVAVNQSLFALRTRESMALENMKNGDSTLNFKGMINIKAPQQGIITSVKYQSGDYVQEGDELATIADQNSLVFILEVPVELDRYVAANRNCTIELPDSHNIKGIISGKLPEMDLQAQTIKYIIKVSTTENIPENLIANVPIIKETHEHTMVLPRKAVLSDETESEFWVMKLISDSVAVKTFIRKGMESDDEIEISEPGFLPTDRIILTGNYGLPDTANVSVTKE